MKEHMNIQADGRSISSGRLRSFAMSWHVGHVKGSLAKVLDSVKVKLLEMANLCVADGASRGSLDLAVNPRLAELLTGQSLSVSRLDLEGQTVRVVPDPALAIEIHRLTTDLNEATLQSWGLEQVLDAGKSVEVDWNVEIAKMTAERPFTHMVSTTQDQ